MTETALIHLAAAAGLSPDWTDFRGQTRSVSPDSLRAVLTAMGLPAGSPAQIADSTKRLAAETSTNSGLVIGRAGETVRIAGLAASAEIRLDNGAVLPVTPTPRGGLHLPDQPGYHALLSGDRTIPLAVTPHKGWRIQDTAGGPRRVWGTAAQVYSLRGGATAGFGDFRALGEAAEAMGRRGADALAVSPVHALFAADPGRYGPYGPSTRLFLNGLYADPAPFLPDEPTGDDAGDFVDWPRAAAHKWQRLRAAYARFAAGSDLRGAFDAFVRDGGEPLLSHARFEALDGRFRAEGIWHWRDWPEGFADAAGPAVAALKADDPEVAFHLFVQFLADRSLGTAQARAVQAGMGIGLISDLAVGMDGAGSHAWSRPDDVLTGIGIGAPPDLLGPHGQNWGLTTFSPRALAATGYAPFLATLRTAMRHAGGVRIDHAMGLKHLWVVPEGAEASDGLYLSYPLHDLMNLTALESRLHKAIVIGEDLGTVPEGFRETMSAHGVLGMRVLWFERDEEGHVPPAAEWQVDAAAMTTTHDLPTVAGWWQGNDVTWRARIDGSDPADQMSEREADKARLLTRLDLDEASGTDEEAIVDAAIAYVGETACTLAIVPLEDFVGMAEQPNLPGTTDEHPNWRRRLPEGDLAHRDDVARRAEQLNLSRPRS